MQKGIYTSFALLALAEQQRGDAQKHETHAQANTQTETHTDSNTDTGIYQDRDTRSKREHQ